MSKQSPIFIKIETFMVWLFAHTARFPKHERFRLAKRIDDALFDFHACLVRAAQTQTQEKLSEADNHLNLLRAYLRIGVELGYTTPKQYQYASEHTSELGKLLGGWMKKA
ncbi:MAG: diversity-generating retroelement protein Avd [Anaerolineae bacterium]|nr:diversity-generating retroelement protein Avd [Anaerolineae bacterium]